MPGPELNAAKPGRRLVSRAQADVIDNAAQETRLEAITGADCSPVIHTRDENAIIMKLLDIYESAHPLPWVWCITTVVVAVLWGE